jgi:hypothetical protein
MSNHEDELKDIMGKVRFDDKPDGRHRDALEKRLLHTMVQAPRRPSAQAEIWSTIMTSKFTKVVAVLAVVAIAAILISRTGTPDNPSSFDILAKATAAEGTMFSGKGITHIVNEITLYTNAKSDAGKLLTDLESGATNEKNIAFMKSWLAQKWVPICLLCGTSWM